MILGIKRLDTPQTVLMLLCAFDAGFFCYYLFTYSIHTQSTISETLFTRPEYTTVLSVMLGARLTGGLLFLLRFRYKWGQAEIVGLVGILLTIIGWAVLAIRRDTSGHFLGVGLFCIGSFVYSTAFIRLAATHARDATRELVRTVLEAFLLMSTIALFISFVALWVIEEHRSTREASQGYIVEHAAYLTHLLFYTVFFLYHSPDPEKVYCSNRGADRSDYDEDEVPMVCRPLIFTQRLPVIMETVVTQV